MKRLRVTCEVWREGGMFTSYCPELDVASCGRTLAEAKTNLIEVIGINIEETRRMGTLRALLEEAGFPLDDDAQVIEMRREIVEKVEIPIGVL